MCGEQASAGSTGKITLDAWRAFKDRFRSDPGFGYSVDAVQAAIDAMLEGATEMGQDTRDRDDLNEPTGEGVPFAIKPIDGNREPVRKVQLDGQDSGLDPADTIEPFGEDPFLKNKGVEVEEEAEVGEAVSRDVMEWEERRKKAAATAAERKARKQEEWEQSIKAVSEGYKEMGPEDAIVYSTKETRMVTEESAERNLTDNLLYAVRSYAEETGQMPKGDRLVDRIPMVLGIVRAETGID